MGKATGRRAGAGFKLLVTGGLFVLLPAFTKHTPLGNGLAPLRTIGVLMLIAGVFILWLQHKLAALEGPNQRTAGGPAIASAASPPRTGDEASSTKQWGRHVFEVIEWRRFEAVVEQLFRQAGFDTKAQSHGADGGVDIWLYSKNQPGAAVSLVQCKHWQGKKVGVDKVRELRGVMAAKAVGRGQFVTTSTFTEEAVAFANANGINLLDVDSLLRLIAKRTPQQQVDLLAVAYEGDYARPTCASCGVKMVERVPSKGGSAFWGCKNFPRCRTTMPMRAAPAG